MKKEQDHIDQEVNKTLESLEGLVKATPKPFLMTRIKAKMEGTSTTTEQIKPAYVRLAFAMVILLASLNFISFSAGDSTVITTEPLAEEEFINQYYPVTMTLDNLEQDINE